MAICTFFRTIKTFLFNRQERPVSNRDLINAVLGKLPLDSPLWHRRTKHGSVIAHMAAYADRLPVGFNRWDIIDKNGKTVAHVAALLGRLPEDFTQWNLVDATGRTVKEAHELYKASR